jgi:hypothetical protein
MIDWSEAGRKAWRTRRANAEHLKWSQAGKKAWTTRRRRDAARKAAATRQKCAAKA